MTIYLMKGATSDDHYLLQNS